MGVVDCTTKRIDQVSWRTAISYLRVILTFVPACRNHIEVYGSRYYLIADLAAAYTLVGGSAE